MLETIQRLLDENGDLRVPAPHLAPDADLYRAGLTPLAAIRLMLALEREFNVKFPEHMLNRQSTSSIRAICSCVRKLRDPSGPPKAA